MNQQIPQNTVLSDDANILSHSRQTLNKHGELIVVPVIDVRDGIVERMIAKSFLKYSNTSRWISRTEYHIPKRKTKV